MIPPTIPFQVRACILIRHATCMDFISTTKAKEAMDAAEEVTITGIYDEFGVIPKVISPQTIPIIDTDKPHKVLAISTHVVGVKTPSELSDIVIILENYVKEITSFLSSNYTRLEIEPLVSISNAPFVVTVDASHTKSRAETQKLAEQAEAQIEDHINNFNKMIAMLSLAQEEPLPHLSQTPAITVQELESTPPLTRRSTQPTTERS